MATKLTSDVVVATPTVAGAWTIGRPSDEPTAPTAVLEVCGITARAPDGTLLLDEVSFSLERGWLVAVVGPTGAGKTSLVRALTGALPVESGTIALAGQDVRTGDETLRRRIGYVAQDDLLHPQLGLRRTLDYAASLRLPTGTPLTERRRRVNGVLTELGLERQAGTRVSSLSGGQRKRANVAVELLGQPDVLVLDEPTSGLDPGYEKSVMTTLRELADRGRTVVTVTHSMASLPVCDRVLFLATGGQVAFFGPPEQATAYFGRTDAADLFLDLDGGVASWKDRFRAHPAYARHVASRFGQVAAASSAPTGTGRPSNWVATEAIAPLPGWGAQLATLVRRYVDLIRADRRHVAMLCLQGPVLGLLLCAVLKPHGLHMLALPHGLRLGSLAPGHAVLGPNAVTVAVFLAISVTWLGTANAVREIVKERRILYRERGTGLSLSAYVGSKIVVLGALSMIQAVALTAIACLRQGPLAHGAVLPSGLIEIMVATALAGLAATALGLLLSALVGTPDKALTALPITLVAQLVLSGAWVSVGNIPVLAQLSDLSGAHWGLQAVEATVQHDAPAWRSAVLALVLLTLGALAATVLLVVRRFQPAGVRHRPAAAPGPETRTALAPTLRRGATLAPVFVASMLVLFGGIAAVGVRFAEPDSSAASSASAAATPRQHTGTDRHAARHPVAPTRPAPAHVTPTQPAGDTSVRLPADTQRITASSTHRAGNVASTAGTAAGVRARTATATTPTTVGSLSLPPPLPSLDQSASAALPSVTVPSAGSAPVAALPTPVPAPSAPTATSPRQSTAAALAAIRAWQTLAAEAAQAAAWQGAQHNQPTHS